MGAGRYTGHTETSPILNRRAEAGRFDMANTLTSDLHRAATWSIVLSILMIAAGLLAIAVPATAGVAVTVLVGWLLIVSGVLHLILSWRGGQASTVVWEILLGVVYGATGVYLLANPAAGLSALTVVVGIYLMVEGILEFLLAFQLRPAPGSGWLLFDGVVTVILAFMIWSTWPSSADWVIGTLVGISMFFSGITRLMLALSVRRIAAA